MPVNFLIYSYELKLEIVEHYLSGKDSIKGTAKNLMWIREMCING
ncbi:insertion element IS1223 [Thermoanaerobacterium thermosaccharolyticum]|uniref:Insertion element IS1223 n=1 Tax=Thermoanaerobacterium thermosaccharolyticum TaxID=1517 RepID=A0A223HZ81_THETR|nr:insertion element IS1223 [Thermoanaerobacterium thermosaccharolyticum]